MCPPSTASPFLGTDIGAGPSAQEPIAEELPSVPPVPPPLMFPRINHCFFILLEAFFLGNVVISTSHSPCPGQWHQLGAAAPLVLCTGGRAECESSSRSSAPSPRTQHDMKCWVQLLQCSTSRLKTLPTISLPDSEPNFGDPKSPLGSQCLSHSDLSPLELLLQSSEMPLTRNILPKQQVLFLQPGSHSHSQMCIPVHLLPALEIPVATAHQNTQNFHKLLWQEGKNLYLSMKVAWVSLKQWNRTNTNSRTNTSKWKHFYSFKKIGVFKNQVDVALEDMD